MHFMDAVWSVPRRQAPKYCRSVQKLMYSLRNKEELNLQSNLSSHVLPRVAP